MNELKHKKPCQAMHGKQNAEIKHVPMHELFKLNSLARSLRMRHSDTCGQKHAVKQLHGGSWESCILLFITVQHGQIYSIAKVEWCGQETKYNPKKDSNDTCNFVVAKEAWPPLILGFHYRRSGPTTFVFLGCQMRRNLIKSNFFVF